MKDIENAIYNFIETRFNSRPLWFTFGIYRRSLVAVSRKSVRLLIEYSENSIYILIWTRLYYGTLWSDWNQAVKFSWMFCILNSNLFMGYTEISIYGLTQMRFLCISTAGKRNCSTALCECFIYRNLRKYTYRFSPWYWRQAEVSLTSRWGRFSPRTSVSPANLHSICFSTIIFTVTRGWHNRPGVAAVPIASQPPPPKSLLYEYVKDA
jgi:hypothetical protein